MIKLTATRPQHCQSFNVDDTCAVACGQCRFTESWSLISTIVQACAYSMQL